MLAHDPDEKTMVFLPQSLSRQVLFDHLFAAKGGLLSVQPSKIPDSKGAGVEAKRPFAESDSADMDALRCLRVFHCRLQFPPNGYPALRDVETYAARSTVVA